MTPILTTNHKLKIYHLSWISFYFNHAENILKIHEKNDIPNSKTFAEYFSTLNFLSISLEKWYNIVTLKQKKKIQIYIKNEREIQITVKMEEKREKNGNAIPVEKSEIQLLTLGSCEDIWHRWLLLTGKMEFFSRSSLYLLYHPRAERLHITILEQEWQ